MKPCRFVSLAIPFLAMIFQCGCFSFSNGGSGTYKIQQTFQSPGNKFKAFVWFGMGGGAAGWCHQKVSILPATETLPIDTEEEKNRIKYVFSTRCSSDIKITWIDDSLVKISYSLGDDPFPTSMSQASRTEDGNIQIVYEIMEK